MGLVSGEGVFKGRKKMDNISKNIHCPQGLGKFKLKTTLTFHVIPIRMTKIKKKTDNKFWRRYAEK